jgi:hypothetical protein
LGDLFSGLEVLKALTRLLLWDLAVTILGVVTAIILFGAELKHYSTPHVVQEVSALVDAQWAHFCCKGKSVGELICLDLDWWIVCDEADVRGY